jgi:hypothetical protein
MCVCVYRCVLDWDEFTSMCVCVCVCVYRCVLDWDEFTSMCVCVCVCVCTGAC